MYVYTLFLCFSLSREYFADQTGVFEIVQAKDITHGKVMKQVYTYIMLVYKRGI